MNIAQPHSLKMHLVRFRYISYLAKFPKKLYFFQNLFSHHCATIIRVSKASRLRWGRNSRHPAFWLVPLNRCGNFVYKCCCYLWMSETWALWARTNSEFDLFFKASTVISLQTTSASRTPSDASEYIFTLFQLGCPISQYFEMLLGHVQLCGLVSYYYVTLPLLKSLSLLKLIYFHFCILVKYMNRFNFVLVITRIRF